VLPLFKTERNEGRHVAYTPPPFEKKRNGGSVWDSCCPCLKRKETGGDVACMPPPFKMKRGQRVGFMRPRLNNNSPPLWGGIIEFEQGGMWISCCLADFWDASSLPSTLSSSSFSFPPLSTCPYPSRRGGMIVVLCDVAYVLFGGRCCW
jgi:hypothetical protein